MEKEEIVYQHLGLPYPGDLSANHVGYLKLGTFQPLQLGTKMIIQIIERYLDLTENLLACSALFPETRQEICKYNFIRFQAYTETYKAFITYQREARAAEGLIREESRHFKQDLAKRRDPFPSLPHVTSEFKNRLRTHYALINHADEHSYVNLLLSERIPITEFFSTPLPFQISENELKRHVLLTGNSGAGKSTFLKRLVEACIEGSRGSVIVIDPAGNMTREIAQQAYMPQERLVYVDPAPRTDALPVFNPLDIPDTDEGSIHLASEEIVTTFQELLRGSGGTDLTNNMYALLYPCVSTLIRLGGKTFFDLQRFLQNDEKLLAAGRASPNQAVANFFETAYTEKKFETTKLSLYTKLQTLLNSEIFAHMTARPCSTILLEAFMNEGKILIVNIGKGAVGADTSEALGRFMIASVKCAVQKRSLTEGEPPPVYLIVDEIQNYISPSIVEILRESRKYGLHLIAATQFISDMEPGVQSAFLSVTNVKITGKNATQTLNTISRETGAKLEDLQNLKLGTFSFKVDTAQPITVTVPPPCESSLSADQWQQLIKKQIELYYLPLNSPAPPETSEELSTVEQSHPKYEL